MNSDSSFCGKKVCLIRVNHFGFGFFSLAVFRIFHWPELLDLGFLLTKQDYVLSCGFLLTWQLKLFDRLQMRHKFRWFYRNFISLAQSTLLVWFANLCYYSFGPPIVAAIGLLCA